MKKLRFLLSVVAISLTMGAVACTSPVAPGHDVGSNSQHDVGSNS